MLGLFIKDKDFYKNVAKIAIPIALQGLITTGVNMLDTVMVGKVGETQLSAVSLANQFINIFHIFCMGIGMGASVLVSRYYGMKDRVGLKKTVSIMLRLCLLMSLIFAVATAVCPTLIMKIYTVEAPIISYGVEYLNYSIITYFLLGLSLTCTIVLRNVGQVRIPLYTSIGAFFVNAGANYVLIFGKLGAPKMGVAGAALGTLIARIFEFAIICGYLFFKDKEIGFRIKHVFEPVGSLWREYMRMSIPVLISDGILALGNNSVAMVIGRLGESFVAANAITTVTQQLSSVMIQGFSQAGAIVTGRTLGEGQREKAYRQGYAPKMGVAGAALGTLIARIFEFAIICGYLFFKDKEIGFRIKHVFEPVGSLWREYMRMSIPVLISDGILALGNNSVAMVIGRLGESFVAANAITTVTQQLSSVMIQGFSQAGAIVTGRTLGEGQREKAYRQGYAFLGLGILFGAVAAGIIMLISEPVITAYDLSPETQALARELMLSISIIVLFQASNSIMTKGVLRGGGDTKILMAADNIFLWIASIPLGILAGFVFDLSAFWIYFFLKVDQVLKAIWCVIRLKSGKWIKKIRSTEEMQ